MIEFHSHEQQDEFIANIFNFKTNGTFLDIASGHPMIGSNCYTFEKYLNWTGYSFDIRDSEQELQWSTHRKNPFFQMDVTSSALRDFLIQQNLQEQVFDYISLDVDSSTGNHIVSVLHWIINSGIKFRSMTVEHEYHLYKDQHRGPSREMLESIGMIRLFEDVKLWGTPSYSFEDWWVHPDYFDKELLDLKSSNLYYFECIEKLKYSLRRNYEATHNCCRAFRDEYKLFHTPVEQQQIGSWYTNNAQYLIR